MPLGIIAGTLIASALQGLFGIGSTMAQNKYNSPEAMKRRVAKAGLPLAYMYQGKVATQQQAPQLSIDPHLGTMAKKQGAKIDVDVAEQLADTQAKDTMSGITHKDPKTGVEYEQTNRMEQQRAASFLKNYEQELKGIELRVEQDAFAEGIPLQQKREALKKAQQQIKNLLAQAGLMDQLKKIRGFEELLNKSLTEDLESMPEWISALLKIILIATKR